MKADSKEVNGRVSIVVSREKNNLTVLIDDGASQTHELPKLIVENSKLIHDLVAADGSRARLPFAYDVVTTWAKLVGSKYQEPEKPAQDQLVAWLRVANFFNDDTSFKRLSSCLAVHVEDQIAATPQHDARRKMLEELPEHEAHSILRQSSAPPLSIITALPPKLRGLAVAALFPDKRTVSLSGAIRADRKAAQAALWALSKPFRNNLSGVTFMDLSGNLMGPQVASVLTPILLSLQQLRVLNLADNDLRPDGLRAVTHGLSDAQCLEELDLSKNQLSSEGFADFTEALANWTELRILRLSVNKIGNQSLKELAQGLAGLSKLEELHVKLCIVGSVASEDPATWDGCLEIAVQAAKLPAFQKLDISDNRIPQSLAVLLMMQLAKAPALEELCVAGNTFDPRHWVLVPQEEIPMFPALRRLGASHCMGSSMLSEEMMIGQDSMISTVLTSLNLSGSQHLVSCLVGDFTVARLQILRHLDVSRTEIAVALLSSVLQQMPELQSLNISAVKAPAAGQGSLEDALRFLTQLTRLDAARAYRKTHQPILPMLSRLENLQHVNLSGRSEPGASLAGLSSLTYLCLAQGNLSGGCAEALATSLPEARPLRHLDISKAKCSFHGLCQILLVAAELPLEYLNISKAAGVRLVQAPIDTVVGASLSHCTRLCDLVWQSAPAGPLQTIGFQLTELTSLTHLDVQGANIGSSLETWDIAWLGLLSGTLRTLNLKNTGLFGASMGIIEAPWVRDRLDQHIIPTLGALTGLRSLNLGANPFSSMSDDSGCGLAKALAKLRSLTMLKLHKCNLSKPTFISVAQLAVPKLLLLKVLDLEGNPAADTDAMHALECGLVGILGLEKLYLSPGGLVCAKAASEDPENIVRRALGGRCDCISCDQSIDLH